MNFIDILEQNVAFIIIGMTLFCILLFILCIVSICKASKLKKRINMFISEEKEGMNIEEMLVSYIDESRKINDRYDMILNSIDNINGKLKFCIQKIGIVRYNPFEEVGGDLCFALALLDENNNGFVLNSIYSREGCYTYAKPIENGVCSKYKLSAEEEQAVLDAKRVL